MAEITMPQLGESVTEGTITRWYKQVGDRVTEDETLFEVSTDKVDSEVPSPASGYLTEIVVAEGGTVEVGATLAVISDSPDGDGAPDDAGAPAPPPRQEAPVEPDASGGGEGRSESAEEAVATDQGGAEPAPQRSANDAGPAATRTAGGLTTSAPVERAPAKGDSAAVERQEPSGPGAQGSRLLSPVVRRLVAEHGLDPDAIEGTGTGGRITRNDVQAVIAAGGGGAGARPDAPRAPAPDQKVAPVEAGTDDEVVPFSNIRRRTAEHMARSKATSAHTLVVMEVDYEGVDRVRLAHKDSFKSEEGVNLTYLPFVSRAVVDAIREFPLVNASVGDDHLVVHRAVHLGIAVDLHFEGLMVPVVHRADGKRLRALAREIAELAARARSRKLGPDDIAGGTFTITNPGPFGTLITGAIINQPQVAILSTDGVRKRPVVVELPDGSDAIAVHPVGNLAITFDHRAVDGAYVSAFVAKVKDILETRDWAAELA